MLAMETMETTRSYYRPPFEDVLDAWKDLLAQRGFSTNLLWILDENLCFERDPAAPAGVKLGFQTQFTPHPPDAPKATYHHFAEMDARMVFYRLGENRGRSICIQLCDPWLEPKNETEGYLRRDEWLVSFFPGPSQGIEEITEPRRWRGGEGAGPPLPGGGVLVDVAARHRQ